MKLMDDIRRWGEGERLREVHPNGIKVKLVVNEPDAEVTKYIFKVALMT